jgi:Uncharacterized conserved protein (DUF2183)
VIARRTLLALLSALPWPALARPLRSNDRVTVLPSLVHRGADGALRLRIEAWVFERERNPTRTRMLAKALGIEWDELGRTDRLRFAERAGLFGADAKDGRDSTLHRAGHAAMAMPPSDEAGRIRAVVPLAGALTAGQWIDWQLGAGVRRFAGRSQWIGDEGLSVVCDIDDTIKDTQVRQRREMLLNTFAREFRAVPGMAPWLARVVQSTPAAALHYVSGSPLQLLPPLAAFVRTHGFPAGSLHLRPLSLQPRALLDDDGTAGHKRAVLAELLADHPRRRFVLVGDSGERDPEIYASIAREHGPRIAAVLIRNASGESADAARYAGAFAGLPRASWQVFSDPAALPARWP